MVSPSGTGHYDAGGVDIQVLQSSASTSANHLDGTTVGGALDKIANKSGGESGGGGSVHHQDMNYGQQALHHVNPRGFQQQQPPPQLQQQHQQLQQQQSTIYPNEQHPHITTVVIPQPLSPAQPPSSVSSAMVLDPAGFPLHQTHDMTSEEEEHLQEQLESLATEQFVGHHVPVELSTANGGTMREGEGPGGDDMVVASPEDGMNFQGIPEGESIVRSISPIRGLSTGHGVFPADKTY